MTWDELLANPGRRDADGVLTVLEEVDDDTGTLGYRRAGESVSLLRPGQLEVRALDGEIVDEPKDKGPDPLRTIVAGVAAAGLAWLATRRRA